MLARPDSLPRGDGWAFELKLDGFRALVDTHDGLRVVSRRGWNMTDRVPELRALPDGLTLDGELVAWGEDDMPSWPRLGDRILHGRDGIAITLFVFDVLRVEDHDTMCLPYDERRTILEELELPRVARVVDCYPDGACLFEAVCRSGSRALSPSDCPTRTGPDGVTGSRRRTAPTGGFRWRSRRSPARARRWERRRAVSPPPPFVVRLSTWRS